MVPADSETMKANLDVDGLCSSIAAAIVWLLWFRYRARNLSELTELRLPNCPCLRHFHGEMWVSRILR
jgi:hypothetical protein